MFKNLASCSSLFYQPGVALNKAEPEQQTIGYSFAFFLNMLFKKEEKILDFTEKLLN